MGGLGSGRRYQHGGDCTDDYRRIDVRSWQREGLLAAGCSFSCKWSRNGETIADINVRTEADRVFFNYRHRRNGGEWKHEDYPVRLDWTACTYGGRRAWFLCPAVGCGRRVAKLYGGAIFACRHCYRLAYRSQREAAHDRAMRRADQIRERLGWMPGLLNTEGGKPKRMRWKTYERLLDNYYTAVNVSLAGSLRRLGITTQV